MTFNIRQLDNLDYDLTEAPWSVEEVRNIANLNEL
jgi:hypothetical protein